MELGMEGSLILPALAYAPHPPIPQLWPLPEMGLGTIWENSAGLPWPAKEYSWSLFSF